MATIVIPSTDRLTVDAAQAAEHDGAEITVCPRSQAQRKGVVEGAIKYLTRSEGATAFNDERGTALAGSLERGCRRPGTGSDRSAQRGAIRRRCPAARTLRVRLPDHD